VAKKKISNKKKPKVEQVGQVLQVGKASKVKKAKKNTSIRKSNSKSHDTRGTSGTRDTPSLSMDELLEKYGSKVKNYSRGDRVEGTILEITPKRVVVDIGGKSEGLIAEKTYKEAESYIKTLKVGDKISASIIVTETPEGFCVLSLRKVVRDAIWKKIAESLSKHTPMSIEGKAVNAAGVMVNISGLTGFIPKSQLGREAAKSPNSLIGKRFEAVVIDADRTGNKIVLSEKEVSEKEELGFIREAIEKIKEGDEFEGEVGGIYDFGCFVKITTGKGKTSTKLEGLVHISELSWDKVVKPSDVVSVGEKVKVKVIGKTKGKLAFSIKQAQDDPWEDVSKKYKKDKKVKGRVTKLSDFGIFVALEPGIEGLIHMTKIPPGKSFNKGDEVNVYVEEVNKKARKISLGLVLTEKPVGYK
jgi:small subunit ribosomal protein S1